MRNARLACWRAREHAALALGHLAESGRALGSETIEALGAMLRGADLVRRVCAAFALAFAAPSTTGVRPALAERETRFEELARVWCLFDSPLTGILARGRHALE